MLLIIAAIFALRIFGLMAVLPSLIHGTTGYHSYSVFLAGIAVGVYGLVQALLHVPMGYLSDKIGRKKTVLLGLLIMFLGSVIAAVSDSIYGLILGRALQGAGAIGSVLNAWCADICDPNKLARYMAIIGMTIGLTFMLAISLGPMLVVRYGLSGVFFITALLSLIAMSMALIVKENSSKNTCGFIDQLGFVVSDSLALKANFGIFTLHASFTAMFLVLPKWVNSYIGIAAAPMFYAKMVVFSLLFFLPIIFLIESRGWLKNVLFSVSLALFLSQIYLIIFPKLWYYPVFIYFATFTALESLLPSFLAKSVQQSYKGTAMGLFSSCQYLGIFSGGAFGGYLLHNYGTFGLLLLGVCLSFFWLLFSLGLVAKKT